MRALLDWIGDRSGLSLALSRVGARRLPGRACVCRAWPAVILFAFCVQALTGFFLWCYYSPSAQTAWESVYYLQYEVTGGWLLRAMHHNSAQVLLVLVGLYLAETIVTRAYRAPREFVYWTALLLGFVTLASLLSGDLLAWDQNSYAATQTRVSFLNFLPVIGDGLFRIAVGGPSFGHLTLTRFFAMHVALFGGGFLLLLWLHRGLARRAEAARAAEAETSTPFWPNQALVNAVACVVVLAVLLGLSLRHGVSGPHCGVGLGSPADLDPANFYAAARPEWAFLGLYEFAHLLTLVGLPGIVPIFVVPGLLALVLLAMPLIDRVKGGYVFNVSLLLLLLAADVALSWNTLRRDADDEAHQAAIVAESRLADRVVELARPPQGIPATGALTLLRSDPQTQGPRLYARLCAACHNYGAPPQEAIVCAEPSAPELYRFAGREWIAGLLDPERIKTSHYFGNTTLRRGDMVEFVRDTFSDLDEEGKQEVRLIATALSAEAQLPAQAERDAQDTPKITEGRTLIVDYCTECHKFHGEGSLGGAPELTGYGSPAWLVAFISDPEQARFYGDRNDRMPAYHARPQKPEENQLTLEQIEMLVTWLRGGSP